MNKRKITFKKPNYRLFVWIGYEYIIYGNRIQYSKNVNLSKKVLKNTHRYWDLKKKGKGQNAYQITRADICAIH